MKHESYKPLTKREIAIGVTLFAVIGFSLVFNIGFKHVMAAQLVAQAAAAPVPPPSKIKLIEKVNQTRIQNGVAPLTEDTRLDTSAQTKADDMVANNYYDHADKNGVEGYQLAENAIPSCTYISENMTEASSATDALTGWMDSPDHKAAILDSKYSLTGFGVATHGSYFYIVEHFCQIAPPKPTYTPPPTTQTTGATALCVDGTPSYSAHHQGACSHHGGVSEWYN